MMCISVELERLYGVKIIERDDEAQSFFSSLSSASQALRVRLVGLKCFPVFTQDAARAVRSLVFEYCRFKAVDDSIANLSSLSLLHFHFFYCEEMIHLPPSFGSLTHLTSLSFTGPNIYLFTCACVIIRTFRDVRMSCE
jgi:hypothetical protein